MIGSQLGRYRVTALLGRGGFAEVYRAHDDALGRDVAVKLLHRDVAGEPDAAARVAREARAVAALSHPHIAVIHEVAEFDGRPAIVMELVEGKPLSESIPPGGLPPERVARWGTQIADALAHAHAKGIVHRDLKGANVVVTSEGRLKLLDFGLARSAGHASGLNTALTQTGVLSGTPSFMAPEILRGAPADAKSDLWALGVLLYQMATGRLPFDGATSAEVSAAILTSRPDALPQRLPQALRTTIERCLEPDPAQRPASADDVRRALESPAAGGVDRTAATVARASSRARFQAIAVLVGIAALIGLAVWRSRPRPDESSRAPTQRQLTTNPDGDPVFYSYLSPDGNYVACMDSRGAYVRTVASGESRPLVLPPNFTPIRLGSWADWFPDGTRLLVGGKLPDGRSTLWSVPIVGGAPRLLVDNGELGAVSPDGSAFAFLRAGTGGPELWHSTSDGTHTRRLAESDSTGVISSYGLAWEPEGRRIAYARRAVTAKGVPIVRLLSTDLAGVSRAVLDDSLGARLHPLTAVAWMPDGRVVFALSEPAPNASDMNLWSQGIDGASGAPKGRASQRTHLVRVSYPLPSRPTRDGTRMSVTLLQYPTDIYVGTLARTGAALADVRRLTLDSRDDDAPSWSRDSRSVLFSSDRNGTFDVFEQSVDSAAAAVVVSGPGEQIGARASGDDRWLLYWNYSDAFDPTAEAGLRCAPRTGGPSRELLRVPGWATYRPGSGAAPGMIVEARGDSVFVDELDPERGRGASLARMELPHWSAWDASPDGRTLAFSTAPDSGARIRLYDTTRRSWSAVRVPGLALVDGIQWAPDGAGWYVYGPSNDGWLILYVRPDGRAERLLEPLPWMRGFAVSPDGKRMAFARNTVQSNAWLFEGL